jgi:hypothetical protein
MGQGDYNPQLGKRTNSRRTATQANKGMCFVFIATFSFLLMAHRDGG